MNQKSKRTPKQASNIKKETAFIESEAQENKDIEVDFVYQNQKDSVNSVDDPSLNPDKSSIGKKLLKKRKFKLGLVAALIFFILPIGFLFFKAYSNLAKTGLNLSPGQIFQQEEDIVLEGEATGRINLLLIGNGGENHESGVLTDTLIVASIDPVQNRIAMLSIPRDLYVDIPNYGKAKINEAYEAGESLNPGSGTTTLINVVEKITGIDVNYSIVGSFEALVQSVDAVGGITVNNPEAITDYNYPYNDPYPCTRNNLGTCTIQFDQGLIDLDGKSALMYARSRYSTSDYDRAYRQQLILSAILDKSLSTSNLVNINFISKMLDIAGNNIKIDKKLSVKDLLHLYNLVKVVDKSQIYNYVLSDAPDNYLVQIPSDIFILGPKSGNYSEIQNLVKNIFVILAIQNEQPNILIENATTTSGLAQNLATQLTELGFGVYDYQQSSQEGLSGNIIVDYSGGKLPNTISYLEKLLNTTAITETNPADGNYNVKIVLGSEKASLVETNP